MSAWLDLIVFNIISLMIAFRSPMQSFKDKVRLNLN